MEKDLEHEELLLVEKINTLINSKTSMEEVFNAIIDGLINVFGYYSSGAYLLSDDKKYLIVKDYYIPSRIARGIERLIGFSLKGYKIPIFEGSILKKCVDEREAIVVSGPGELQEVLEHHTMDSRLRGLAGPIVRLSGLKSGVGISLIVEGDVVGLLGISSNDHDLGPEDVRRLEAFGVQATLAIKKVRLYEELEDYSKNLEERVVEKTRELEITQKRLFLTEKFAALGRLAAGVAHEINNPLGNISLSVELMMRRETDHYKLKKMETVLEQVESASVIVKNLLAYSREAELKLVELDLNPVIEKALELSEQELSIAGIKLIKELSPKKLRLNGDPKRLQQVFLNIITNAIQAMPKGGSLYVSTGEEGDDVFVELDDTGPGIPVEIRDKVFDPFFSTKDLSTSAGLGLSVSKGIIDEHNGTIEIKDSQKFGTAVLIKIPVGDSRNE